MEADTEERPTIAAISEREKLARAVADAAAPLSDGEIAAAIKERARLLNAWIESARRRGLSVRIEVKDATDRGLSNAEKRIHTPNVAVHVYRSL